MKYTIDINEYTIELELDIHYWEELATFHEPASGDYEVDYTILKVTDNDMDRDILSRLYDVFRKVYHTKIDAALYNEEASTIIERYKEECQDRITEQAIERYIDDNRNGY